MRDVSAIIAAKVRDVAHREERGLTVGTLAFVDAHSDPTDEQQMLPCGSEELNSPLWLPRSEAITAQRDGSHSCRARHA